MAFTVPGSNTYTLKGLSGSRALDIGGNALSLGGTATTSSYSGDLSGTGGSLTKTGTGTLTLSGTNSLSGGTSRGRRRHPRRGVVDGSATAFGTARRDARQLDQRHGRRHDSDPRTPAYLSRHRRPVLRTPTRPRRRFSTAPFRSAERTTSAATATSPSTAWSAAALELLLLQAGRRHLDLRQRGQHLRRLLLPDRRRDGGHQARQRRPDQLARPGLGRAKPVRVRLRWLRRWHAPLHRLLGQLDRPGLLARGHGQHLRHVGHDRRCHAQDHGRRLGRRQLTKAGSRNSPSPASTPTPAAPRSPPARWNSTGVLGSGSYSGGISNAGRSSSTQPPSQTLSGAISGTGSLTKDNAGTLTLSGNSSFTGGLTLADVTLGSARPSDRLERHDLLRRRHPAILRLQHADYSGRFSTARQPAGSASTPPARAVTLCHGSHSIRRRRSRSSAAAPSPSRAPTPTPAARASPPAR